jgi:hypothetical protein
MQYINIKDKGFLGEKFNLNVLEQLNMIWGNLAKSSCGSTFITHLAK